MSNIQTNNTAVSHGNNNVSGGINFSGNVIGRDAHIHMGASPERDLKLWTVPRHSHRLFTGREDVLSFLEGAFRRSEGQPPSQRRAVITGIGGTGKSDVAIKYAETHRDQFWAVFWVDCSTLSSAEEGFKQIGQHCKVDNPTANNVKSHLASVTDEWLLICDNADDPKRDQSQHFPSGSRGSIILTSRNPACSVLATEGLNPQERLFFELDQLGEDTACKLLLAAAGIPEDDASQEQIKDEAMSITKELGHHTLALLHAGSYIKKKFCDIGEYLELYRAQKDELFSHTNDQESSTYGTVQATFEVSIKRIETLSQEGKADAPVARDALDLLNALAFFPKDGPFEKIFALAGQAANQLLEDERPEMGEPVLLAGKTPIEELPHTSVPLTKYHASLLPTFAPRPGGPLTSRLSWRKACNLLSACSMIKTSMVQSYVNYSIHPLLHAWLLQRLDAVTGRKAWWTSSTTLALATSKPHYYSPKPVFKMDTLYVRRNLEFLVSGGYLDVSKDADMVPVIWRLLWVLCHRTSKAVDIGQSVLGLVNVAHECGLEAEDAKEVAAFFTLVVRDNQSEVFSVGAKVIPMTTQLMKEKLSHATWDANSSDEDARQREDRLRLWQLETEGLTIAWETAIGSLKDPRRELQDHYKKRLDFLGLAHPATLDSLAKLGECLLLEQGTAKEAVACLVPILSLPAQNASHALNMARFTLSQALLVNNDFDRGLKLFQSPGLSEFSRSMPFGLNRNSELISDAQNGLSGCGDGNSHSKDPAVIAEQDVEHGTFPIEETQRLAATLLQMIEQREPLKPFAGTTQQIDFSFPAPFLENMIYKLPLVLSRVCVQVGVRLDVIIRLLSEEGFGTFAKTRPHNFLTVRDLLARAYLKRGMYEDARTVYQELVPSHAETSLRVFCEVNDLAKIYSGNVDLYLRYAGAGTDAEKILFNFLRNDGYSIFTAGQSAAQGAVTHCIARLSTDDTSGAVSQMTAMLAVIKGMDLEEQAFTACWLSTAYYLNDQLEQSRKVLEESSACQADVADRSYATAEERYCPGPHILRILGKFLLGRIVGDFGPNAAIDGSNENVEADDGAEDLEEAEELDLDNKKGKERDRDDGESTDIEETRMDTDSPDSMFGLDVDMMIEKSTAHYASDPFFKDDLFVKRRFQFEAAMSIWKKHLGEGHGVIFLASVHLIGFHLMCPTGVPSEGIIMAEELLAKLSGASCETGILKDVKDHVEQLLSVARARVGKS